MSSPGSGAPGTSNSTVPFRVQTGVPDPYRVASQNRTYTRYLGIATEIIPAFTEEARKIKAG